MSAEADIEHGSGTNSSSKLLSDRELERREQRGGGKAPPQSRAAEDYRRSGKAFLDKALEDASGQSTDVPQSGRKGRGPKTDQDFAAFGAAFNKVKVPVYVGVLVVMAAAQPLLVKNSLRSMRAPAILLFLHQLAAALTLWAASSYELPTQRLQVDKLQLNLQSVKGAAVPAAIGALQMLCMFSALHHTSILLVLCWMCTANEVIEAGFNYLVHGMRPSQETGSLLSVALGATVLQILFGGSTTILGLLMLLLWGVFRGGDLLWMYLKTDPEFFRFEVGSQTTFYISNLIRECCDEGEALAAKPATLAFLSNVLPLGPVLLLGFLCLEGSELASHEPSVPAMETMLLACGCYVLTTCATLLAHQQLSSKTKLQPTIRAAGVLGAVVALCFVDPRAVSFFTIVCTLVAGGAANYGLLRKVVS